MIEEAFTTFTPVAAVPPKLTVAPVKKPVPEMVTAVPPAVPPVLGETPVTVGAGFTYVYALALEPLCVSVLVTTIVTAPAVWAGVVVVIEVLFTTVTPVAAVPPRLTVAPVWKLVPVMVMAVPPATGPLVGKTDATVGAGFGAT